MKTNTLLQKSLLPVAASVLLSACAVDSSKHVVAPVAEVSVPAVADQTLVAVSTPPVESKRKIQIALLLDTSNSMDGLIDQARAQLWKLVNELGLARYGDEKPALEIALYEYGNDNLSMREGYVRQVVPFSGDLDLISEQLFALKTHGGTELCGQVIASATGQLTWENNDDDLRLIFIAGNESFHQGQVSSISSCSEAQKKGIVVNTIFCGNNEGGIEMGWLSGSQAAGGNYMSIEQDKKTVYIETPFDNELAQLNDRLNATYVHYGYKGALKKENQLRQDQNAGSYGKANVANRTVSKSGKFYSNKEWDLVDASKQKEFDVAKLKEEELPAELKNKTAEQKKHYVAAKTKEREEINRQIAELGARRNAWIAEQAKHSENTDNSLDAVMLKAIRAQAEKRHFSFDL